MSFEKLVLYDFNDTQFERRFTDGLRRFADDVDIVLADGDYSGDLEFEDVEDADALIVRPFNNFPDRFFNDTDLEYVGTTHTDTSNFDPELLEEEGITLTNVPAYAGEAVAELTVAMMLNLARHTKEAMDHVEQGDWSFHQFLGRELRGKKIGIIGLGSIGSRVAELAAAFGMDVVYYDPNVSESAYEERSLEKLMRESDVVSVHCPLTEETNHLLDEQRIGMMKEGAYLLNPGRSEIVDLEAVYDTVEEGQLSAWFEAVEDEDMREQFNSLERVYLTPHYGWWTEEAQQRLRDTVIVNIRNYLEGEPENTVTG